MKFFKKVIEFFFGKKVKVIPTTHKQVTSNVYQLKPCKSGMPRKRACLIKINQKQATEIIEAKKAMDHWNSVNPGDRVTTAKLTQQLNARFNMDKTRTYYGNIWNGHTGWDIT